MVHLPQSHPIHQTRTIGRFPGRSVYPDGQHTMSCILSQMNLLLPYSHGVVCVFLSQIYHVLNLS